MVRVAINGFGRIGRCFLRAAWHDPSVEIVAINDLGELENLAYLLQYDSVYRRFPTEVGIANGALMVGAKRIAVSGEKDPVKLPWKYLNIDVVVESTGVFDSYEKARAHITAGGRKGVITAPGQEAGPDSATALVGGNEEKM